jgi:hypothetical protein
MKKLFFATVAVVALSTPAFAESMIIRTPFGGMRIEVPQQVPRPVPPQPAPQQEAIGGLQPSFDCALAHSFVAQALCKDPDGSAADWELNAASWAHQGTLSPEGSDRFAKAETAWVHELANRCRDSRCVIDAYHNRAAQYRRNLHGLALAEARSTLEHRIQIHEALFDKGFMKPRFKGYSPKPDGEFGPNTRAAIKEFQASIEAPQTGFLSEQQTARLLETPEQASARIAAENLAKEARRNRQEIQAQIAKITDVKVRQCIERREPSHATDAGYVEMMKSAVNDCQEQVAREAAIARAIAQGKLELQNKIKAAHEKVQKCVSQREPVGHYIDTQYIETMTEALSDCQAQFEEAQRQEKNKQELEGRVAKADPMVSACYDKERPANATELPPTDFNIQRLTQVLTDCESKVAKQQAELERQRREAEKWRKRIEEAREKGTEYAKKNDSLWSISGRYNEMTDTTDYTVNSQQGNETGALADVRGFCEETGVTFTATLTSKYSDHPITFRKAGLGVVGQRRINDEPVTDWAFMHREWSNRFEVATLSFEHDDPTSAETTWRILGTFETSMGPMLIRVPTFDDNIQRMVVECKKTLERTAARPHRVGG